MAGSTNVILSAVYLTSGVFIFLLGLTILRIGRESAPTRATALMLFFAGIGPLLSATGIILQGTLREGAVLNQSINDSFEYLWEFYFPSLMLFALSFPRANPAIQRFPILGLVLFLPYIVHLLVMMSGDWILDMAGSFSQAFAGDRDISLGSREVRIGMIDNIAGPIARLLERVHRHLFALVNITYSAVALLLLWRNRRQLLNPRIAGQLRTMGIGLAISLGCYSATKIASMVRAPFMSDDASLALVNLSLVASGGTIAYTVIRQQFLGMRDVLRRGLLYSGVAVLFAALYLVIVRPISAFFGQYSAVSKEAFDTGFIILAVIAFQPTLNRAEEVLGRALLKGREGATRRFRRLGEAVASSTTLEELDRVLTEGLRDVVDASDVELVLLGHNPGTTPFVLLLEEIGEPVRRQDLLRLLRSPVDSGPTGWRNWFRLPSEPERPTIDLELLAVLEQTGYDLIGKGSSQARFELFVPLVRGSVSVGYVALAEKIYGVPYNENEIGHLSLLATQIGAALQNIHLLEESLERKLFEEELKIARKIQTQLLPGDPPVLPGFELCAVTVPSRYVGGDYYDFVVLDDRWLAVVVADVSGKGIPASILTASLQATVRSNTDAHMHPDAMMDRLNRLLFSNTSASEFATLFYAVIDTQTGEVRYANAGHDFPFLASGDGVTQLAHSGIVLGCIEEFEYPENSVALPHDGVLVIYTDGITESQSQSGEYFGTRRLRETIAAHQSETASVICQSIVGAVRSFGTDEGQDDLTLVVIKRSE